MKRRSSCLAVAATLLLLAAPAAAGVFELDAQIHTGGMAGTGVWGDRKGEAFHEGASGFGYGARVGAEVLFIDGWVEHNQYYNGERVDGTWTQFMLGIDGKFDVGEEVGALPGRRGRPGRRGAGFRRGFVELGVGLGYGVGTGQQVEPPLDNSELSDKGFVFQVALDAGYRFNKAISMGVHIPLQGGYLFRTDEVANDLSNQYGSMEAAVLLTMRVNISLTD